MTRRARLATPDRASRRGDWRRLARDGQAAAEGCPGETVELARRAMLARDSWPWPLPFPDGIAFSVLAHAAWAFARAGDGQARLRLAPTLRAAAGCCLELLDASEPGSQAGTAHEAAKLAAFQARLPYRED